MRARAATMTSFLGWTAEQVAAASDEEWEDVHRRLHAWAGVLRRRGLASLTETITLVERLPGRVLSVVDGERRLTDLRHVGQLLHSAAAADSLGTAALAVWLRQRVEAAEREGDEERSRRLESDAQAVQVLTIHRSKGLEFPVVYVPYLWEPTWVDEKPCPIVYHDPAADFTRTIDVGLAGEAYKRHKEQHVDEQRGEDLRLAYVALTRAKHQAVVWWAGSWNSRDSALSRLLFARDADGNVASSGQRPPSDESARRPLPRARRGRSGLRQRLADRASRAAGRLVGHAAAAGRAGGLGLRPPAGPRLAPHVLQRHHRRRPRGRAWRASRRRRSSPTSPRTTSRARRCRNVPLRAPFLHRRPRHAASDGTMSLFGDDDPFAAPPAAPSPPAPAPDAALLSVPALLAAGPGGTAFGTFAHTVFEAADFAAPDLDAELARAVGEALARRPVDIGDRATVIAGLKAAIETPLGPLVGGRRLKDFARADRLDELTFELPLAGGDQPQGQITPGRDRRRAARAARARRPAVRLRRPARRPRAAGRRARLSDGQHRPRRAGRRRASRSPTTRRTGSRRPARS